MIDLKELKIRYITDEEGHKSEVILPLEDFESLLEDLRDLAIIAERRDEDTIDHDTLISELKHAGLL